MITLTERCKQIVIELLNNDIVTLKGLEGSIKVSRKTLVKDLDIIDEFLEQFNITLYRKPKVGIWLIGEEEQKVYLQSLIGFKQHDLPNSSKERQAYIMSRLLNSNEYITIQNLADEMYVSKGTVNNELLKVKELVKSKGLKLEKKQNRGIIIKGKEEAIRHEYANMITDEENLNYMLNLMNDSNLSEGNDNFKSYFSNEFLHIFNENDVSKISEIIKDVEGDLGGIFSDSAFVALVIHIAIAIKRIKEGYKIKTDFVNLRKIKNTLEYSLAIKLTDKIQSAFKVQMPTEEIGYIAMHILGAKLLKVNNEEISTYMISGIFDESLKRNVKDMITKGEEVLQARLSDDELLYEYLLIHLRTAINRLVNNMPIKNPYIKEIKKKYPLAFESAVNAFEVLEEIYNLEASEDEIGYIAVHFEASLERIRIKNNSLINVVVVCSTGMGTSQLVTAKLKRVFSDIEILDVISAIDTKNNPLLEKADIVISTIPIVIKHKCVIIVNPFLPENDIKNIKRQIKKSYTNPRESRNKKIDNIYNEDLVLLNADYANKEELLKSICDMLQKKGYVTKDYINTVISREKISSTSYENIAIPHGDHSEVIKPCIVICTLKKSICWDKYKVKIVFLICMNNSIKKYLGEIFNNLYDLIDDQDKVKQILGKSSKNEVLDIVLNN
ncbi:MAG: BglG family transcription antiterminator [Clostridium sp.]|uniref:BglG family transcription antiterminator n=1 Tax=Clostridium sp. TaxID=1506 RepID=UPI002910D520|nr:BglG family transcription antiterminator [Clostridium sp.]MDU5109800.1 BglG family transcription antiterminator [Clostridium sp.]